MGLSSSSELVIHSNVENHTIFVQQTMMIGQRKPVTENKENLCRLDVDMGSWMVDLWSGKGIYCKHTGTIGYLSITNRQEIAHNSLGRCIFLISFRETLTCFEWPERMILISHMKNHN